LGFFVGILYSIRTIAILYPLVIIIYLICIDQKNIHKIIKSLSLIVGMILVLLLIGLHNYKRADVFYFTPMQSKMDLQTYFVPGILIRSEDFNTLTQVEIAKIYKKMKQNILNNKDYDLTKEKDQILVAGDVLKNSLNIIFDNKIIFLKMISKNYFYSMLLNPVQVYFTSKYQKWEDYKNSLQHKYWLKIRVIFTIIFFSLSVLGFFCSLKKISLKLNIFFFLSTLYFFFTSCWLGNTRYFTPSSLFLSFYFSLAINKFYFKFFHKIKTLT